MAERTEDKESLIVRIQQLETERDELRKDIEQLCFPQAGPGYVVAATRMHYQRTAGLEQEIEILKKKLAACIRDNQNLQEELSEVYHIKSQLADLHNAEVSKNVEAEKQLKFFQGCVASAFAERDSSLMEAVNAKEREETMSKKLNDLQKRVEELTVDYLEEKKLYTAAQVELLKLKEQDGNFKKVIIKFYDIRKSFLRGCEEFDLERKCECLLQDALETWSFDNSRESSTSDYVTVLEKELQTLKNSLDNLQNRLQMGLEIEDHLKKKVYELEADKILSYDLLKIRISDLRHVHTQSRCEIMSLLEQERAQFKSMLGMLQEKLVQLHASRKSSLNSLQGDEKLDDIECRDVHMSIDTDHSLIPQNNVPSTTNTWTDEAHAAFAQALREKVATLLLLSQQDERHMLERNVNAALQDKVEELKRNLLQVTNEKVKALVELARLRQENQVLQENIHHRMKLGNFLTDTGDKNILAHEREEGKLKNLLKKTYLSRWVGRPDMSGNETGAQGNASNSKSNYSVDIARMKVENATLKESIESLEHLTSSIHRLRLSLVKVQNCATSPGPATCTIEALTDIINEARVVRTALGSSLPVSWSAEAETGSVGAIVVYDSSNSGGDTSSEKIDFVSASGLEMVELLILAAQFLKHNFDDKRSIGEC